MRDRLEPADAEEQNARCEDGLKVETLKVLTNGVRGAVMG